MKIINTTALAMALLLVCGGAQAAQQDGQVERLQVQVQHLNQDIRELQTDLALLNQRLDKLNQINSAMALLEQQVLELRQELHASAGVVAVPLAPAGGPANKRRLVVPATW